MNENKSSNGMKRVINLLSLFLILTGFIACAVSAATAQSYWTFFGLLSVISLATLLPGALLGVLFGIPRLNSNYNPRDNYSSTTKYTPNTNLEEISDWLTKIIIGVTLTQLGKIHVYLQQVADYIVSNSNCYYIPCDAARPIIIALICYFLIAGFIIAYFYTRLYLPNLFAIMEESSIREAELSIWKEGSEKARLMSERNEAKEVASSLSDDELTILHKIKTADNRFDKQAVKTVREQAAVNVLLHKAIINELKEETPGTGNRYAIIDTETMNALDERINKQPV